MTGIGLNHITLAVSDLERSVRFYVDGFDADLKARWESGAYLDIGGLWLCLALGQVAPRQDYTHIAFGCEPEDFAARAARLRSLGTEWQPNTSEGQSLYILDPDGHRLELHVGTLDDRLAHYRAHPEKGVTPISD